ncbi:MAG: DUF1801 domain-containing protein [Firmicutes bacterium]|nr:DUF1801 domain-containing protein [Bacillota bacterium]MBQ6809955.1 DUF1801 domain-containing protein [Bacillota bacterium]
MWTCPKCGREFKRTNQDHYCGKAPETVDAYIALQIPEAKAHLVELRDIIQSSVPDITEGIAWSMPIYKRNKQSISFAACKEHVSFYTDAAILESLRSLPGEFKIKKNALYLPYDKEIPRNIIEDIVKKSFSCV